MNPHDSQLDGKRRPAAALGSMLCAVTRKLGDTTFTQQLQPGGFSILYIGYSGATVADSVVPIALYHAGAPAVFREDHYIGGFFGPELTFYAPPKVRVWAAGAAWRLAVWAAATWKWPLRRLYLSDPTPPHPTPTLAPARS